jgi:hypothetical protein
MKIKLINIGKIIVALLILIMIGSRFIEKTSNIYIYLMYFETALAILGLFIVLKLLIKPRKKK